MNGKRTANCATGMRRRGPRILRGRFPPKVEPPPTIPQQIPIAVDEYRFDRIGTHGDREQFIAWDDGLMAVLHLFDSAGWHVETRAWLESEEQHASALDHAIAQLENVRVGPVRVRPFEINTEDIRLEFVPTVDGRGVEFLPEGLLFHEPWDGTYDT
jgi:hypothetical protein